MGVFKVPLYSCRARYPFTAVVFVIFINMPRVLGGSSGGWRFLMGEVPLYPGYRRSNALGLPREGRFLLVLLARASPGA